MSPLAQAANEIKQEAGFATLTLPSCFDAGRCRIGGTMVKADERLILVVFNYD